MLAQRAMLCAMIWPALRQSLARRFNAGTQSDKRIVVAWRQLILISESKGLTGHDYFSLSLAAL